jgi:hypothetical protein
MSTTRTTIVAGLVAVFRNGARLKGRVGHSRIGQKDLNVFGARIVTVTFELHRRNRRSLNSR